MERNTAQQNSFEPVSLITSPQRLLQFPYPSPVPSINPPPLHKEAMAPPSNSVIHSDPFFYTPRQLAEHLLLTYPPDYKVSPTQLKHSIILGNDVSGKVFLSAIPGPGDLESMLGVGTLGARVWLWDEMTKMRRASKGYSDWRRENKVQEKEVGEIILLPVESSVGGVKRSRAAERLGSSMGKEPRAKRQARWVAVRTTPVSDDTASTSPETPGSKRREEEESSFAPYSRSTTSSTISSATASATGSATCTAEIGISDRETTGGWDSDTHQEEVTRPPGLFPQPGPMKRKDSHTSQLARRPLRPRSHNLRRLMKSELVDILDPEVLDISQITIMLYAIREVPEIDLYEEFIRAARVTAREKGLPPSMLAIEEDRVIVEIVHEMAAVYSSWVLSKPYPLESLNPEDVERIADFDLFLQFKVQFLNLLIPYEKRRRSSSYRTWDGRYRTPTPTPTPTAIPKVSSKTRQPKLGLVTSDLSSPVINHDTDRCPETGYTAKQREWGETIVKISGHAHKIRSGQRPHRRPTKPFKFGKELENGLESGPENLKDSQAVPWGVDYLQGSLTPEGLRAFVDWASAEGKSNLLLWKCLNPKAYAEFKKGISNMESQLVEGVAKLEELEAKTW